MANDIVRCGLIEIVVQASTTMVSSRQQIESTIVNNFTAKQKPRFIFACRSFALNITSANI